jgi:glycerophosphoryl diester phosphodiesterase
MPASPRALVVGHRGASGYRPEHTRAAYELAFAQGADLVEPDVVATRDGVLVVRHENEISGTTDVARRPEFRDRRTTKRIDGAKLDGWFTEDFTWAELATLRAVERLPALRPGSAAHDGEQPMLRLDELLRLVDDGAERRGRRVGVVAELKHATHFASIGLPLDELVDRDLRAWAGADADAADEHGVPRLVVESFEQDVLERLRERGLPGRRVMLVEDDGAPADLVARDGSAARPYADFTTDAGLAALAATLDGVSVPRTLLVRSDGRDIRTSDLVSRAHAAGLAAFTWTLRPENRFLTRAARIGREPGASGDWRREFGAVLDTGVDGVFADHPDLLRELVDSRG